MPINKDDKCIWITTDWEVNLLSENSNNYGRMNSLAVYLQEKGYEVVLWTTGFSHPEKKFTVEKTEIVEIKNGLKMVLLHTCIVYKKNMSPTRFLQYSLLSKEMKRLMNSGELEPPDTIFCSYPPAQYCKVALKYADKKDIPVIVDARDQWPDIFTRAFPKCVRRLAGLFLIPLKRENRKIFSSAEAICAMSPVNLQWALNYAGRKKGRNDKYIFIGNKKLELSDEVEKELLVKWREIGVTSDTWNICLFSTLSATAIDLDTVIKAVKIVHEKHEEIRFVIGGTGDDEMRLKEMAKDCGYIVFMGWMNQNQMTSLMSISKVGSLCYANTKDFRDGWGNKVGQYLSYGLPLLTSAEGFAKTYIEQYDCGVAYKEKDENNLADVLIELIENPQYLKKLTDNAYDRFLSDFESTHVMEQFEEMIKNVILTNRADR